MGRSVGMSTISDISTINLAYTPWDAWEIPTNQLATPAKHTPRCGCRCKTAKSHTQNVAVSAETKRATASSYWHKYPIEDFSYPVTNLQTTAENISANATGGAPAAGSPVVPQISLQKDDFIAEEMNKLLKPYQDIVNDTIINAKEVREMAGAWNHQMVNKTYVNNDVEVELRYGPSQLPEEIVIRRLDDAGNMALIAAVGLSNIFDPGTRSADEQIHKHVANIVDNLVRPAISARQQFAKTTDTI